MFLFELLLLPIIIFIILSILILPFQFAFHSIINIITVPAQFIKIASNKKLRINHALEHSTINVLEKKYGYRGLAGYAKENGFVIRGKVHPTHLENAAIIGLDKLNQGYNELAIHKRCGTSMLAANFTSAVIFILLLWQTGMFSIFNIFVAILLSQFVGPTTGKILQKFITTSTDVSYIDITGIDYNANNIVGILGFNFKTAPNEFFVRTHRINEIEIMT
ncbi:DUF6391 domain-containing protein [Natranaerobius trueperi]|uniref:Uncharacterized protein n=1 Tax=Natranaerobius trueperi TaxID=759412 RepID=A0A226BXB7_9FIRM|nr:DUF6391 domain-containing protein [Natranaerobius trueperi]OWZ83422.1 hypothetical protein CDO51_08500 [Natranaerobius trueperi]